MNLHKQEENINVLNEGDNFSIHHREARIQIFLTIKKYFLFTPGSRLNSSPLSTILNPYSGGSPGTNLIYRRYFAIYAVFIAMTPFSTKLGASPPGVKLVVAE